MTTHRKRVAVPGGRGMLGSDLCAALSAAGHTPLPVDLPEFDLTRQEHLEKVLLAVDAVVNCAAYTQVDRAESEAALAAAVNHHAVAALGALAASRGLYVIHIGTDFVFDGRLDRPYRESDPPAPLSVYGATKLAGEESLRASGCRHAVVRVQWTYGAAGANFITRFLERAAARDDLLMVADQVGAPTWTADVARVLVRLLDVEAEGLYHYAAAGYATRFEVAQALLELTGLRGKALKPCRTADFPAAAVRPLNSRFDCAAIDQVLGETRPHWRASLEEFLRRHPPRLPRG